MGPPRMPAFAPATTLSPNSSRFFAALRNCHTGVAELSAVTCNRKANEGRQHDHFFAGP